ncbi:RHOMBOID-like protein 9, chloroplastic [Ipomoea triloba]|uniref:RHOMBOID-like protein 9, chloroplastic n=1 Tax=Ipomoea triloba TaxID=35885 RepID=UPI00125E1C25|nr:RHOMBOID-like protein 9, chloroplastic [Ipomoea triloba]
MACGAVLGGRVQKQGCLEHLGILRRPPLSGLLRRRVCRVQNALNSSERQLRCLDAYFDKLHDDSKRFSILNNGRAKLQDKIKELAAESAVRSLDKIMAKAGDHMSSDSDGKTREVSPYTSAKIIYGGGNKAKKFHNYVEVKANDGETGLKNSDEDTSSLYLIGTLASINVGVFLFEIASPVRSAELELCSIPSLYGAKINDLILIGEWWRLVTPMFLHSGVLHMALGIWVLLSFGPPVCKAYGSFTFFLIYVLGGISGNLISFLHTPEPTIGGTGPVFALIGAWLVCKAQNRDMVEKEVHGSMFWKAMLATALSFVLSTFGPIDDWSHFGAAVVGVAYGYLACPTLEMDNASSDSSQKEGITLLKQSADPCKSLMYFSVFILLLCSLLLIMEPPLSSVSIDEF